jgi:general secretion pathway protein G
MKRVVSSTSGMTLIEIMIVIAILGMMAAVVAVNVVPNIRTAEEKTAVTEIRSLESALRMFRLDCGRYPSKVEGLDALVQKPATCRSWKNYLSVPEVPTDPWSQPYQYYEPGEHGQDVEVASLGADGAPNSGDDLVSWTADGRMKESG